MSLNIFHACNLSSRSSSPSSWSRSSNWGYCCNCCCCCWRSCCGCLCFDCCCYCCKSFSTFFCLNISFFGFFKAFFKIFGIFKESIFCCKNYNSFIVINIKKSGIPSSASVTFPLSFFFICFK